MATKFINYTLPEFVFLEATSHDGNPLEGRDVLQHIRSYTVLEVVNITYDEDVHHFTQPTWPFTYKNNFGVVEKHLFVLHFSLAHEQGLPINDTLKEIFERCAEWYCKYLAWEDGNIFSEAKSTLQ